MSKTKKDFSKEVRSAKKAKCYTKKKAAIHQMIEAILSDNSEMAATHFHTFLQMKSQDVILGEESEEDEKEEKGEKEDSEKEGEKEDDKSSKADVKEGTDGLPKEVKSVIAKKVKAGVAATKGEKPTKKQKKSAVEDFNSKEAGKEVNASTEWKEGAKPE